MQPFSLNIAQQPGQVATPDFQVMAYADLHAASNSELTIPLAAAVAVFLDNHGADVLFVQLGAGSSVFSFVLDAHEEKQFVAPVPLDRLTVTDVGHTGIEPFIGPVAGAVGDYHYAPSETMGDPTVSGIALTGYLAVTTCDQPFSLAGYYRSRPHMTLADPATANLFSSTQPLPVQLVGPGGATALPLAVETLYNPGPPAFEYQRTPSSFKSWALSSGAGTSITLWTPAAGRRFRLMGFTMITTPGQNVTLTDGATAEIIVNTNDERTITFPANGYLSVAAGNALIANVQANTTLFGGCWGTEEP